MSLGEGVSSDWLRHPIDTVTAWNQSRLQRNAILDENKQARERLSFLARRVKDLVDSPSYRSKEIRGSDRATTMTYFDNPRLGVGYGPWVSRYSWGQESFGVWVNTRPLDQTHYTTGANDGSWILKYRPPFLAKANAKLEVSEGRLNGDIYLGSRGDTWQERVNNPRPIEEINVTSDATSVSLREISFGGYPSLHLTLRAWGEDPRNGELVGPIGRVREIWVHGISRKVDPSKGNGVMDSETETVAIPDEFSEEELAINMPRGGINLSIARREGTLVIRAESLWKRSPDRQLYIGNEPLIYKGPFDKTIILPSEYLNGFRVIELLERAVDNLIESTQLLLPPRS